jgi:hypothetical protein
MAADGLRNAVDSYVKAQDERIVNQSNRAPEASETGAADVPGDAPIEGHPPSTTDDPPADDDADGSGEAAGQ